MDVNPVDGASFITYTNDAGGRGTYIARQVSGASAIAGKAVTDRSLVLGKKSGLDSIRIKADELGLDVPEGLRAELLARVKRLGEEKRGLVTDDEFRELLLTLGR